MIRAHTLMLSFSLAVAATAAAQEPPPADAAAVLAEEARLAAEEARLDAAEAAAVERPAHVPDPAPVHPELRGTFEQFGGRAGLDALMDTFMADLLADPRTGPFFAEVDHDRVKQMLSLQFCAILGGGCAYTGRDMVESHAALRIDRADFNALVEVLQVAMDKHDVPFRAQNRLLAVLAPMHREIVND